jgi:hypothetical protein
MHGTEALQYDGVYQDIMPCKRRYWALQASSRSIMQPAHGAPSMLTEFFSHTQCCASPEVMTASSQATQPAEGHISGRAEGRDVLLPALAIPGIPPTLDLQFLDPVRAVASSLPHALSQYFFT